MIDTQTPPSLAGTCLEANPRIHTGIPELLAENGFSTETITALLHFDVAVFQWRRMGEREEFRGKVMAGLSDTLEPALLQGLISVARIQAGLGQCEACPPTIGLVAQEMAIDPSRASRIVSDLVSRGYVERKVAQEDARRSVLDMTLKGRAFLAEFMKAKWQVILQVFEGWSDNDVEMFSKLFTRFVASTAEVVARKD